MHRLIIIKIVCLHHVLLLCNWWGRILRCHWKENTGVGDFNSIVKSIFTVYFLRHNCIFLITDYFDRRSCTRRTVVKKCWNAVICAGESKTKRNVCRVYTGAPTTRIRLWNKTPTICAWSVSRTPCPRLRPYRYSESLIFSSIRFRGAAKPCRSRVLFRKKKKNASKI